MGDEDAKVGRNEGDHDESSEKGLMTAEEERELAELLEDDD